MLEVEQDSAAVERGLDNLISKLTSLRDVVSNSRGYGNTAKGIAAIGDAARNLTDSSASNLRKVVDALQGLSTLSNIKLSSSIASQIKGIGDATRTLQSVNWDGVKDLATNIKPLADIPKAAGLASTLTAMRKLPEAVESINTQLDDTKIAKFAERVTVLRNAIVPLADEMRAVTAGFSALPRKIQKAINATNKFSAASENAYKRSNGLLRRLTSIATAYLSIRSIWNFGTSAFSESNDFIESVNLANVAMGDAAKSAMEYAKVVEDLVGINMTDWMTQMGTFNQMLAGFGIPLKQTAKMSQQLTQLGYDIQSAFNAKDLNQVMDRLQSGLAGQIKGMREYGVELSVSAMREFALARGITKTWTEMSMAEKTALRYAKIMADTTNIQQDLARTIATPANSLRILNAQWEVAKRYVGQFVSVIATRLIPIVQTAVAVISALAQTLASAWGYVLPDIPTTGIVGGFEDVEDAIDDIGGAAGGASKKMKGLLASWDEINVIQSESGGGGGGGSSVIQDAFDFTDLTEYSYDFLEGIKSKTKDITATVKNMIPWLKLAGGLFATWKATDSIVKFIGAVKTFLDTMKAGSFWKIPLAVTGAVAGFTLVYDAASNIFANNKITIASLVEGALGTVITGVTVGAATGSAPIALAVAAGVTLTATLTAFYLQRQKEYSEMAKEVFSQTGANGVSPDAIVEAIEEEFKKRTRSAQLIVEAYSDIPDLETTLADASGIISQFNSFITGDEALSEAEATSFKNAWNTVFDTLDAISQKSYDTVFAGLSEAAQSANETLAATAKEAQINFTIMHTGLSRTMAELQVEMDGLSDLIATGQATEDDMKRYNQLSRALMVSDDQIKTQMQFEDVVSRSAAVNFESVDAVKTYADELKSVYQKYVDVEKAAYDAYVASIELERISARRAFDAGEMTDEEWRQTNALLDKSIRIYSESFKEKQEELRKIASEQLQNIMEQAFMLPIPKIGMMSENEIEAYLGSILLPIYNTLHDSGILLDGELDTWGGYISRLKEVVSEEGKLLSAWDIIPGAGGEFIKKYLGTYLAKGTAIAFEFLDDKAESNPGGRAAQEWIAIINEIKRLEQEGITIKVHDEEIVASTANATLLNTELETVQTERDVLINASKVLSAIGDSQDLVNTLGLTEEERIIVMDAANLIATLSETQSLNEDLALTETQRQLLVDASQVLLAASDAQTLNGEMALTDTERNLLIETSQLTGAITNADTLQEALDATETETLINVSTSSVTTASAAVTGLNGDIAGLAVETPINVTSDSITNANNEVTALRTNLEETQDALLKFDVRTAEQLFRDLQLALTMPELANMDTANLENYMETVVYPLLEKLESNPAYNVHSEWFKSVKEQIGGIVDKVGKELGENPFTEGMEKFGYFLVENVFQGKGQNEQLLSYLTGVADALSDVSGDYEKRTNQFIDTVSNLYEKTTPRQHAFGISDDLEQIDEFIPKLEENLASYEEFKGEMTEGEFMIEISADPTEIPTAIAELEDAVSEASKEIKDMLTFEFTITVDAMPLGAASIIKTSAIQQYAEGGIPTTGSLFIAHESGPELVGQFGNGTGVANSDQIVSGITAGVAQANASQNALLREQNALLRELLDKEFTAQVTPSVALGQATKRSIDMFNRVSGVNA